MRRALLTLATMLALLAAGGCAINRTSATADDSLRWETIKTMHVKQFEGRDGSTKQLIAEKFRSRGFTVTADPEPMPQVDAVVTYVDKWWWDITMYMIELTITLREPKTDQPLAIGNSYHTSLTRKSQQEMVDEVVENILRQRR